MKKLTIDRKSLWQPLALAGVVLLAAILRFGNLSSLGYGNHYYTAAMLSMLKSWHNFFFVAAEPGGSITVDKPPLGLWIQAASVFIFGLNTFGLLLPEILAGLGSVILLFFLVKRQFGPVAGLLAALVLAVTPVVIAVDRNNTMDSLLIFCLLLAAWAFLRAIETNRDKYLFLAAVLVGAAFNIKMLEAYLPLPAFSALYFFGSHQHIGKKIGRLLLAALVIAAVSFSWVTIVQLVPADQRPYIGSSGDNSEYSLIFGYNGVQRLLGMGQSLLSRNNGQGFPSGRSGFGGGNRQTTPNLSASTQAAPSGQGFGNNNPQGGSGQPSSTQAVPSGQGFGGGGPQNNPNQSASTQSSNTQSFTGRSGPTQLGAGRAFTSGINDIGQPGWLRLFQDPLFKNASWLLPLALLGIIVIAIRHKFQWPLTPRHQAMLVWGLWLLAAVAFFNIATFFHEYYLALLAPPLAVLVGMLIIELWELHQQKPWLAAFLLIAGSALTLGLQINEMAGYIHTTFPWKVTLWGVLFLGSLALIFASTKWSHSWSRLAGFSLILAAMMISPMVWSVLTMLYPSANQSLPAAYAGTTEGPTNGGGVQVNTDLLTYLEAHTQGVTYLLAVPSSMQGSDYVIATGRPVLYIGGFMGVDEILSSTQLAQMVANHQIRFLYWDTANIGYRTVGNTSGYDDLSTWITGHCTKVTGFDTRTQNAGAPDGTSNSAQSGYMTISLYDCGQ